MVSFNLYEFGTRITVVTELVSTDKISVKECCKALKISRSTWYNRVSEVVGAYSCSIKNKLWGYNKWLIKKKSYRGL